MHRRGGVKAGCLARPARLDSDAIDRADANKGAPFVAREDYIAVGIRLFAIYLALSTLGMAANAVGMAALVESQGIGAGLWTAGAAIVLVAATALWLWFFPLTVARKLLPVMNEPRSEQAAGPAVLASVALTLMGVWLLAGALIDATFWLTWATTMRGSGFDATPFTGEQVANMVATAVEAVLALVLIFGASGLRRLLFRFRYGPAAGRMAD